MKCSEEKEIDIGIIEMLFSTSLIAVILSSRRLHITNTKRHKVICELTFSNTVLAVKMNRRRLIVLLECQIYLYDISNMKLLQVIETSPNPHAICSLSPSSDRCYLVYPRPQAADGSAFRPPSHAPPGGAQPPAPTGDVLIYDALNTKAVNVVEAHKSPLSSVALNSEGTLLATASDKGTVIRVFGVPDATKLYQFRRGTYPARIYSMSFNLASTLLCVSSATETVHIFRIGGANPELGLESSQSTGFRRRSLSSSSNDGDSAFGRAPPLLSGNNDEGGKSLAGILKRSSQFMGRSMAGAVGGYLPAAVTEMWEPARDFAFVKLPHGGVRSVVALSSTSPQIMVVTSEGYFYVYNVDMEKGGECVLVKQYSLLDSSEKMGQSVMWE